MVKIHDILIYKCETWKSKETLTRGLEFEAAKQELTNNFRLRKTIRYHTKNGVPTPNKSTVTETLILDIEQR